MIQDLYYSLKVSAGGAEYQLANDVNTFTVEENTDGPSSAMIEIKDPERVLSHAIQEGMVIEVDLGTVEDHSLVFRGRIYRVEGTFPGEGVPVLRVTAYDSRMQMGLRPRSRPFTGATASEIVETVAGEYFSNLEVTIQGDADFDVNGLRQNNQTDLDFIQTLARLFACQPHLRLEDTDETFTFLPEVELLQREPAVTLYYDRCDAAGALRSFEPSVDIAQRRRPSQLSSIDAEGGEETGIEETAAVEAEESEDPFLDENLSRLEERSPERATQLRALISAAEAERTTLQEELTGPTFDVSPPFLTADQASTRAGNAIATGIHGMRARGTAVGVTLRANDMLAVQNVGGRFSGAWYLAQVSHQFDGEGYQIEFECRR